MQVFIQRVHQRLGQANFSIITTGFTQVLSSILGFVMLPLMMRYFSTNDYSLWVTLLSLITWINLFDFGIGYSFRNKITAFLVDKDKNKITNLFFECLQYYAIISVILLVIFGILLFNVKILAENKILALWIYIPAILVFPLGISGQILQGLRLSHLASLYNLAKTFTWALIIAILVFYGRQANLIYTSVLFSSLNLCLNSFIFYVALKKVGLGLPSVKYFLQKPIFNTTIATGLEFFVLQISSLLLFSMGNYYIYSNLTPTDTIQYDTINKIFMLYFAFYNTTIGVYWAEIVFHKTAKDYLQLKKIYQRLLLFSFLCTLGAFVLTLVAPPFIYYWTVKRVTVTTSECLPFAVLIAFQSIAYAGAVVMNAFEQVRLQIILAVISILLLFPVMQFGFTNGWRIATPALTSAILIIPAMIGCNIMAARLIKSVKDEVNVSTNV
jgi:O-antigen/teichoic acid export membrane protein